MLKLLVRRGVPRLPQLLRQDFLSACTLYPTKKFVLLFLDGKKVFKNAKLRGCMKNRRKVEYELTVVFREKTFKLTNN